MIIKEWRKFRGWYVLEFFLESSKEVYVKELARNLKISPQTASYYLKFYAEEGILEERKEGPLLLYSLNDTPIVKALKTFYILNILEEFVGKFCKKNKIISLVLYGSYASGDYDKSADIDLLIISQQKKHQLEEIKQLEKETGKEVKIQTVSLGEWKNLRREKDKFVQSLLLNHILLYGAEI